MIIIGILFFESVDVLGYIGRFSDIELSLQSGGETNLMMVYYLPNVFLNSVHKYFSENFLVYVHQRN